MVKPGDRVAYTSQPGGYAEESLVKADSLIPLPEDFSFEQGAAFPLQGLTAHYLIHGMGLLLVQWAKHYGATVIGTVSTEEKAKAAKEAGADEIIFYNTENFVDAVKRLTNEVGVQLIIDGVGKTTFAGDLEAIARRGTVVIFGSASGPADPISPNGLQAKSITVAGGSLHNFLLTREELLHRANHFLTGVKEGWLMQISPNFLSQPIEDSVG